MDIRRYWVPLPSCLLAQGGLLDAPAPPLNAQTRLTLIKHVLSLVWRDAGVYQDHSRPSTATIFEEMTLPSPTHYRLDFYPDSFRNDSAGLDSATPIPIPRIGEMIDPRRSPLLGGLTIDQDGEVWFVKEISHAYVKFEDENRHYAEVLIEAVPRPASFK